MDCDDIDETNQPKRQCILLSKGTVSPVRLRALTLDYIIEDMFLLSTVDWWHFINTSFHSLTLHLNKVFEDIEQKVKAALE